MKISKEQLIEKLIPVVLGSLTLDDLESFVASRLEEKAHVILDEWACRELKEMAEKMEDLPE